MYAVHNARGNLTVRQQMADRAGCICYVEQHLNATNRPDINYCLAIIDLNASAKSKEWARHYCTLVSTRFNIPDRGVLVGPSRGSYNVKLTRCPAFLAEPGFVSNPEFAGIVRTGEGIDALARCLADSIVDCFPEGGLVGLSVGHKYRGKDDPGAPVFEKNGLHDPAFDDEAELNDAIIKATEEMLLAHIEAIVPESIR